MITELFINSCILITFITIGYIFLKNKDISRNSPVFVKVIVGLCSSLLGILLMLFTVPITSTIIIDFRYLPILLSAIYLDFLPPIIASILIGAFRVLYFGISNASIIAFIDVMLIGIGFSLLSCIKATRKTKCIYSIIYLLTVTSITTIFIIKDSVLLIKLLILYPTAIIIVTYFAFYYTEYLSETVQFYNKLKDEATVDFLTGLNNVRQFDKAFKNLTQHAIRKGESISILILDIDYFKSVNDTYGHSSGDIVLKNLADIFNDTCRSFDVISRIGGEEFSVLLLDCPPLHAVRVAERIRQNVEAYEFDISNKISFHITISVGVSTYPDMTDNIDNLIEDADAALYEAKRTGRNKVVLCNSKNA